MSVGQNTSGMRAFISNGKVGIIMPGYTDLFAIELSNSNIIISEIQFIDMFGDLGQKVNR